MVYYLVVNNRNGEEFMVKAKNRPECKEILKKYGFFNATIRGALTEEEADYNDFLTIYSK